MNRSLIFMMSCFAILPLFVNAVEWKVKVNGGEIYYLFQPLTGSLNDLTVRDNKGFSFKPSNYGGITRFVLSGEELRVWEHRHKTTILNESFTNGVYSARVIYEYKGDKLEFLLRLYISDKSLVIEYSEIGSYGKVRQFSFDRSENTPEPRIITLPYGHNVLYTNGEFISAILDIHYSNASQIHTPYYLYSSSSAYFGDHAEYLPCTNGNYNMLKERMIISVSPEISDTFYRPSNPVSAYKDELSNKIVLDFWGDLRSTLSQLKTLANWGYRDILALIHVWQRYGYDNGLPTTYPAGEMYGGGAVMREIIELCHQNNYLFALHTNYVDFYENSDDWNTQDIALNPDGSWVKAWFNPTTNMQSYLIKPTEAKKYAAIYEPLIKDNYLTNAGYLDVHTAIRPSMKVDFDSRITYCSKQFSTLTNYLKLIDYVRSVHKGPIAGEGFGFSAPVWAGYIDAIEADPRSIYDVHKGLGGSDVPLIVDYKLKILHNLFVPHGVGYLPRFFYEQWKDYTKRQIESYRLAEMAFGNAGFMQDPFITYPSDTEIRRDYCFLKHIQKWIFSSNVLSIEYFVDEGLAELSHALKLVLPDTTFDNVTKVLRERLTRLRIKYDNGLTLYINYSGSEWYILYDGVIYRLPPNGFFVDVPGKFRAYYAAKGSEEIKDYVCPAENICSTCGEPMDVGVDSSEDIPSDIDNYKDASDIELKDLIPIDDREYTDELYILDIAVNDAGIKDEFAYEDTLFSDIPDNGSGIDITLDYVLETSADEEDILKDTFLEDIQSDGREDTVYETTKDVLSHTATDTYQNDLNNTSEGCSCNLVGY